MSVSKEDGEGPSDAVYDPSNYDLIKRLLGLAWRYRLSCLKVLSLQLVLLVLTLSGLGFTGLGIDYIRSRVQPGATAPHWPLGFVPPGNWTPLMVVALVAALVLLFAFFRGVLTYVYSVEVAKFVQGQIVANLRSAVYGKLQRLSFKFFDANASSTLINRVTHDVQATRMFIDMVLLQGMVMILSIVVFFIYMVSINAKLTFACLATTPLLLALSWLFARIVRPAYQKSRRLIDALVSVLSENVMGMRVIKGFAREELAEKRFLRANRRVVRQRFWIFTLMAVFGPLIKVTSHLNIFILLGYGGHMVIRGELALGTGLIVFSGLLQQFSGQIAQISNLTNRIQECLTGARRVFEILDTPVEIKSPDDPKPLTVGEPCSLEFENVTFGYTETDDILHNVNLKVEAGECVAMLGATGSGKTTLLSLIPRFYDPKDGWFLLNGLNAKEYDVDALRRSVGIVFQENFLFSNTISSNIAFGHPDATRAQIEKAAKIAAAHEFITELNDGYETILGETGIGLSGGQRQRIAIARAILLEPSILLLDDPTAAIDAQTEHEILQAMEQAMEGRTTFIVAHRLRTLQRADKVVVIEKGRIVQIGSHDELIEKEGPYKWMVSHQIVDKESQDLLDSMPEPEEAFEATT